MKKYIKPAIKVAELEMEASLCEASTGTTPSDNLGSDEVEKDTDFHSRSYDNYSVWDE